MSLILKQEPANTISTPPAGKSTLFVTDTSTMAVKNPDGTVTFFPTVQGSNTQVFFNDDGAINGNANLTFNKTTSTMTVANLSVTGTLNAGDISVSSIANGTSNVDIIGVSGNVTTSVNGVANVLVVTGTGANITGTLSVSGNVTAGNVSATTFTGALTGAATSATTAGTVTTAAQPNITSVGTLTSVSVSGNANVGNLGTGGLITATGNIQGANLVTGGVLSVTGNANIGNVGTAGLITATGNIGGGNIITAGIVSATGNVSGNFFIGNGSQLTGIDATAIQNGTANVRAFNNANVTVSAAGVANVLEVTGTGANLTGTFSASGNANVGNLGTGGLITATGNLNAGNIITGGIVSATGNGTFGNVSATTFTGALSGAATTAGTVTTNAQPNITSTGTLASLSVTGNVTGGNLVTAGILSVTGTGVSSIAGNLDMTSNNIVNLATPVNDTDAATKAYVDSVAQGLHTHDSCNAATTTTLATISGGTVTYNNGTSGVGATLTTTGSYTTIDGVTLSDGMRILVKDEVTTANNGIYVRTSSTVLTRADDFDTPTEMAGGDFTFVTAGTVYDNTGWVMPDPVTTVGTSPVVWVQFSGAGTYTAGSGLTLTGSVFSVNVAQPTITSVGTLTSLSVSGNANVGNIGAVAGVFTGNVTVGNIISSGTGGNISGANVISANLFTGTLTTAAQPNITSTGTLASLSVTGNINAGNVSATTFTGALSGAATTAGTVTTAAQPNITSTGTLASLSVTGNINAGNVSATTFTGALTGNATGSAATVTTAAQPNITSVGTLTSLAVTGNVSAGNVSATTFTGALTGNASGSAATVTTNAQPNITSVGTLASLSVTATITGSVSGTAATITTAAQPNITSVGTLTSLSVSGQITNGNITTGASGTAGNLTGNWTLSSGSRLQATYADLAEKYVADATYGPGTVLIFGGEHEVTLATEENSSRVAGVVTTNPAYSMNSACEGEHVAEVALQGRVPVKVLGPVYKGDLLVSSANGYATANNLARAGTIIGKSLENFTDATGTIEVAVGRF